MLALNETNSQRFSFKAESPLKCRNALGFDFTAQTHKCYSVRKSVLQGIPIKDDQF